MEKPRVAIVHDWFVGGGAERTVLEMHKAFPEAPIYTAYCSPEWRRRLGSAHIITSYMQAWPFSKLRKFLPLLRVFWFSHLDLSAFDIVLSSSGAEAKGIKVKKPAIHVNYCYAPTHYYWNRYEDYLRHPGFGYFDFLARFALKLLVGPMRRWDYKAAQRPDYMIAISTYIQAEIKKYYNRDSVIIFPPVDVERFRNTLPQQRSSLVAGGRQTVYKRLDLAVKAATKLGLPLTVIGDGPEHQRLLRLAGPTVKFVERPSDDEMSDYFRSAEVFIFPGLDDFGIVAVEAMAAGTPIIAYGEGGALDYVEPGKTGLLFKPQTAEALIDALKRLKSEHFDSRIIADRAKDFRPEIFREQIRKYVLGLKKS